MTSVPSVPIGIQPLRIDGVIASPGSSGAAALNLRGARLRHRDLASFAALHLAVRTPAERTR